MQTTGTMSLADWCAETYRNRQQLPKMPLFAVDEAVIERSIADAYYDHLDTIREFREEFNDLLAGWTWRSAERIVREWSLPARGLSDLIWSHQMCVISRGRVRRLRAGSRLSAPRRTGRFPSWLHNQRSRKTNARRLYQYAVEGKSFRAIAAEETGHAPAAVDTKAVRRAVTEWARVLRIQLKPRRN